MYCTISINSAHPCDRDTLDQFGTLAQAGRDRDIVKISALLRVWKCYFAVLGTKIGAAEGRESENAWNRPKTGKIVPIWAKFVAFWSCHTMDLFGTQLRDPWQWPIFGRTQVSVTRDCRIDRNGTVQVKTTLSHSKKSCHTSRDLQLGESFRSWQIWQTARVQGSGCRRCIPIEGVELKSEPITTLFLERDPCTDLRFWESNHNRVSTRYMSHFWFDFFFVRLQFAIAWLN